MKRYQCVVFFNDTATTEIYTLSLHDALPILVGTGMEEKTARDSGQVILSRVAGIVDSVTGDQVTVRDEDGTLHTYRLDRKSTRLNSSHANISYAVFCLKKKKSSHSRSSPRTH